MANKFKISVIIPNYNYSDYIVETLESVAAQTYENWECIIIDDGSTDDSREVINAFITKSCDDRFKLFFINNSGTSAAKNYGLNVAKGELLQFLDADDLIEPYKFERQIDVILNKGIDLIFSESKFFNFVNGQREFFEKFPKGYLANTSLEGYPLLEKIITNNVFTISSPLFKKNIAPEEGFIGDLNNNEDWLFWIKIALSNPLFYYESSPQTGTLIRNHSKSAMQSSEKMFMGEVVVRAEIEKLMGQYKNITEEQKLKLIYLNKKLLSFHHIRSVDLKNGFSLLFDCLVQKPLDASVLLISGGARLLKRLIKNNAC